MTLEKQDFTPSDAVDALIRYIEHFGDSPLTVQSLLDSGHDYGSIVDLFDTAITSNTPLTPKREETNENR